MQEKKTESGLNRKFLFGIAVMLSIAVVFVAFAKEALMTFGFSFIDSIVIAITCYVVSIILYKVVV
jgi:hypothetical protein